MLFIIVYCVLGGVAVFGLLYLLYRRNVKKERLLSKRLYTKLPAVFGIINTALGGAFVALLLTNPSAFAAEQSIYSPVPNVLFSIFSSYFYFLAMPLSVGYIGISVLLHKKEYISGKRFWVSALTNGVGALLIAILTYQVFG